MGKIIASYACAIYLTCVRYNLFDIETSLTPDAFIYSDVNMLLEMSLIETQEMIYSKPC